LRSTRSGWQHHSVANFYKVKGKKWLEFSSADHIIPLNISLPEAIRARHLKCISKSDAEEGMVGQGCEDLRRLQEGISVLAGFKCLRLIGLEGFDNHNRLWLEEEIVLHVQLVKEAVASEAMPDSEIHVELVEGRVAQSPSPLAEGEGEMVIGKEEPRGAVPLASTSSRYAV